MLRTLSSITILGKQGWFVADIPDEIFQKKNFSCIWCLSNSVKVLTSNYLQFSSEVDNEKKWLVILLSLDLLPASSVNVENSLLA